MTVENSVVVMPALELLAGEAISLGTLVIVGAVLDDVVEVDDEDCELEELDWLELVDDIVDEVVVVDEVDDARDCDV